LAEWVESSPEQVVAFRVYLGERGETSTVGVVLLDDTLEARFPRYSCTLCETLIEAAELVEGIAESAGWRTEYPLLRVVALDSSAKHASSWQRSSIVRIEEDEREEPVSAMAGELIRMCAEVRRSLQVVTDGAVAMQERHDESLERMMETREDLAETAAELELVSTIAELEEEPVADPLELATANMLEQVAASMLGARTLSPAQAKRLLSESPELLAHLVADPEVVGLFVGALGALEAAGGTRADELEDGLTDVARDLSDKKEEDELETP
jgi:hypothetical protein